MVVKSCFQHGPIRQAHGPEALEGQAHGPEALEGSAIHHLCTYELALKITAFMQHQLRIEYGSIILVGSVLTNPSLPQSLST